MSRAALLYAFLLLGPGATLAFQVSAPRGARHNRCAVRCTGSQPDAEPAAGSAEPAPEAELAEPAPEAKLLVAPALRRKEDFTLEDGAKEMQRTLIGTEFGLQVGAATLLFGGAMWWSTLALAEDPFWSSPVFPQ